MQEQQTTRRRFLVAALAVSGMGATFGSAWLRLGIARADWTELETLGHLANMLFPHDGLDVTVYGEIMRDLLDEAVSDEATADLLDAAIAALDTARSHPWLELDAAEQLAVLQEVQDTAFFAGIREKVRLRLYYHPVFWKHIDYPGSSKEHGGYINRGFDDIAWLPEDA